MFIRIALSLAFTLITTLTAVRAEDPFDPATLMPANTFAYACFDVNALQRGVDTLDIVRVLRSPDYKEFFAPLLADVPLEEFLKLTDVREWVNGIAAGGISAFTVKLRGFDGDYTTVRVEPGKPVDPKLLNLLWRARLTGRGPAVVFGVEGVFVIDPGEKLRAWLDDFLTNPPVPFTHKVVQSGTHQILSIVCEPFRKEGIWIAPELHVDIGADRWVVATSAALLEKATASGLSNTPRRHSLREDQRFVDARARHTSGERVIFSYVDGPKVFAMARPFLPPVVQNSMAINGLGSIENVAVGLSIVNGGFRESFGVGLRENPKGFWRLLDAFPPGLKSVEQTSPRAVGHIAVKLDLSLFDKRIDEVFGELLLGLEELTRGHIEELAASVGIDYDKEVLPALGDEFAMSFFLSASPEPETALNVRLRDETAFRALASKIQVLLANEQIKLETHEFDDESKGWRGFFPMRTMFRIHDKHLLGSTNAASLRRMIASWDKQEKTLARDGEVFRKVMQGMNGGTTDDLVLLAYADVRHWMPLLLAFGSSLGVLRNGPLDATKMPNTTKLAAEFSGLATSLRRDKSGIAFETYSPIGGVASFAVLVSSVRSGGMVAVPIEVRRAR